MNQYNQIQSKTSISLTNWLKFYVRTVIETEKWPYFLQLKRKKCYKLWLCLQSYMLTVKWYLFISNFITFDNLFGLITKTMFSNNYFEFIIDIITKYWLWYALLQNTFNANIVCGRIIKNALQILWYWYLIFITYQSKLGFIYSVDFIFLSFGIMGNIVELWNYKMVTNEA